MDYCGFKTYFTLENTPKDKFIFAIMKNLINIKIKHK